VFLSDKSNHIKGQNSLNYSDKEKPSVFNGL